MCGHTSSREKLETWFYCWSEPEGEWKCPPALWALGMIEISTWMCAGYKLDPHVQHAVKPFPGNDWEMGVFACALCIES